MNGTTETPSGPRLPGRSSTARISMRHLRGERGATTAEYAITTMAAVAFAGLLVAIMQSDEVRGMLTELIRRALAIG